MESLQNNIIIDQKQLKKDEKRKEKEKKHQQRLQKKLLRHYTSKMRFYKAVVFCLSGVLKLFFRIKVVGKENMLADGPCFVCCNHLSNWDPVFLAIAVKRPLHYMAKKEIFSVPVLKSIVSGLGAFPVDRENADITAIKTALNHIKYGNAIGIFPQGTRCLGMPPESLKIKNGTGMMVFRTQCDVVPVSIYTKGYKVSLFKPVYIEIGKPIKFEDYNAKAKSHEEYQRISDIIFDRICEQVNSYNDPDKALGE